MKKKMIKIAGVILLLMVGGIGVFVFNYKKMGQTISADYARVETINLSKIDDGIYKGSYAQFLVGVDLEVTIKEHRIENIRIVKQNSGKGYEASDIVPRIIKAQSLKVDAVSGATGSSKTIIIAVHKALTAL